MNKELLLKKLKKYKKLAFTDKMTGLNNEYKFKIDLKNAKYNKKRYNHRFLLIYFDLDNFKNINDTKGHECGNKVLKKFANIILENIRQTDKAYRLGGGADEFIVLIRQGYKKTAKQIVNRIKKKDIEFSFGIGKTLRKAEKEMYKNKKRRRQ